MAAAYFGMECVIKLCFLSLQVIPIPIRYQAKSQQWLKLESMGKLKRSDFYGCACKSAKDYNFYPSAAINFVLLGSAFLVLSKLIHNSVDFLSAFPFSLSLSLSLSLSPMLI